MNPDEAAPDQVSVYTVVLRCTESQLRIPRDRGILIAPIASPYGAHELRILTRTDAAEGIATPVPRELWMEVTGPAPSLEQAVNLAAITADEYVRQVAFGANAWQGLLHVHLAYDRTPGRRERDLFQNWITDERGLPRTARGVDTNLMFRLLAAIAQVPTKDRQRIIRAITHYTDALQHWKRGSELYALAALYVGIEAITPTAIRWEVKRRGFTGRDELQRKVLPKVPMLRRMLGALYVRSGGRIGPTTLEPWARREIIFRGDADTYRTAKRASDELEHGAAPLDALRSAAAQCVEKCARYLRSAIVDFVPLTTEDRTALMGARYESPSSTGGFERQVLAKIISDESDVAAPDQAYPFLRWEFNLKGLEAREDGEYEMTIATKITPVIAENATVQVKNVHFAGAKGMDQIGEIEVTRRKSAPEIEGFEFAVDDPTSDKWVRPLGAFILNCNTLRHLSLHWMIRLTGRGLQDTATFSFQACVEDIRAALAQRVMDTELLNHCEAAWQEAIALDEVRVALAGCVTQPNGLMALDEWSGGKAPLISELQPLVDLNHRAMELIQRLAALLPEALRLATRSDASR